jgi:putative ABC transport system substrate-binding protein
MRRREFIAVVGGTAVWPLLAHAQQLRRRIGYLSGTGNQSDRGPFLEAMLRGLEEFGYIEGKNIIIEYRGAEAKEERIPGLISELVDLKPDVLVMPPVWWAIEIAKEKTKTIPIAMVASDDPVIMGLVKSLSRPGGNITGVFTLTNALNGKRLELLRQMVPGITRVGMLRDIDDPTTTIRFNDYKSAARALDIELHSVEVRGASLDLDATLQNAASQVGGLITITNTALFAHRKQIADLAIKYRLPTMYHGADWVEAGGLMSYAADDREAFHRIAYYVDKILKGAWPGDLPIEQSTKIALVINLQTAKALELRVPSSLLVAADKVIE